METRYAVLDISPVRAVGNGRTPKGVKLTCPPAVLEANVLLFRTVDDGWLALLGLDTLVSSDSLESEVAARLDGAVDVVSVATHTHNAPVLEPRMGGLFDYDEKVVSDTVEVLAEGIRKALAGRSDDVALARGRAAGPGAVYRRARTLTVQPAKWPPVGFTYALAADRGVALPRELDVIVATDAGGATAFVIWSWSCHATACPTPGVFSPDFPGAIRAAFRRMSGNATLPVVYLPGFCGDIRPDISARFSFGKARAIHPFARLFVRGSARAHAEFCAGVEGAAVEAFERRTALRTDERVRLVETRLPTASFFDGTAPATLGIRRLDLGDLRLLLVGAEVSHEHGGGIGRGDGPGTLLSGLAGGVFGYLPTAAQVVEGGYEPRRSQQYFSLRGTFRPDIDATFARAMVQLLSR